MRLSRGEFFKLLGTGAGTAAIVAKVEEKEVAVVKQPKALEVVTERMDAPPTLKAVATPHIPRHTYYDVRTDVLYDRFTGADLQNTRYSGFQRSPGDERFHPVNTNMQMAGCLPAPQVMIVSGITVLLDHDTPDADFAEFTRSVSGTLQLLNKYYSQLPMARVTVRGRLDDFREHHVDLKDNGVQGVFKLDPPLLIEHGMYFKYELLRLSNYHAPLSLGGYICLGGYHAWPIQ